MIFASFRISDWFLALVVAWEKLRLAPGESKTVTPQLEPKLLSIFNEHKDDWELLSGEYKFFVGGSSRETSLTAVAKRSARRDHVRSEPKTPGHLHGHGAQSAVAGPGALVA